MANLKFVPNLFLEVVELERFKKFLDGDGFRKNILQDSINFGLIKSNRDTTFANGRVERDTDVAGIKTLKIAALEAIDKNGNFIHSPEVRHIPLVSSSNWYWLKARYQASSIELGTVSIAPNGDLVGVGTEFTKILRGMPNFPARISFIGSIDNLLEYDVLEVIDDENAILAHPATNSSGFAEFAAESDLQFKIVGTFTPGVVVPTDDKYPFEYDSMYYELIQETVLNTKPTYIPEVEFYLARYKISGANVIVQDKRIEYWETKGSQLFLDIERADNPLIGVESVMWQTDLSPADKNFVNIAWGMRADNWSIDTSKNLLTLFGSSLGGIYKTVDDFSDGDFDGWRVYTANGKYSRVITSIKQGSAINLTLDVLDVDNYSVDGGTTLNVGDLVLVVPNTEEVELLCTAITTGGTEYPNDDEKFTFPVNTPVAKIALQVYLDPECYYNIQYRYKNHKDYTGYQAIPSDTVNGYYTEVSFDKNGNIKPLVDQVLYPYTSVDVNGFIKLNLCPWAYSTLIDNIYKGDTIGVNEITDFGTVNYYDLIVGASKNYQYISGGVALANDTYINLSNVGAVEGNEFRIHIECDTLDLNSKHFRIVQNYVAGVYDLIKEVSLGDLYHMKNQKGGIVFDLVYKGSAWIMYQNYDTGRPFEIVEVDGVMADLFDTGTGLGKVVGYFGHVLCDQARTVNGVTVPDLHRKFLVGAGGSGGYAVGDTGGEESHILTQAELPDVDLSGDGTHNHSMIHSGITGLHSSDAPFTGFINTAGGGIGTYVWGSGISGGTDIGTVDIVPNGAGWTTADAVLSIDVPLGGSDNAHENRPPYYAVIVCKKIY